MRSSEIRKSLNNEPLLLGMRDLGLDAFAMWAECLREDFPNKLYLSMQMGKDQSVDLELMDQLY